jgi:uncharacterized protein YkwD
MKALRTFALAAAMLSLLAPAAAAERPDVSDRLIDKLNEVRANHDLPALREAPKLARLSRSYAAQLIHSDDFSHGYEYQSAFRRTGEMLAIDRGWRLRVATPVRMWLRSPAHSSLLLDRSFRYVGAGHSRGRFGSGLQTIWVVQFGSK